MERVDNRFVIKQGRRFNTIQHVQSTWVGSQVRHGKNAEVTLSRGTRWFDQVYVFEK